MKRLLRTILRILDGSPSASMATPNRQRGQSMLELALITPLLAILVAGAVEVGWYTNRWLSLLEVTRVGARSATFLQNELSPIEWNDDASIFPAIQTELMGIADTEESVSKAENARNCATFSNFGFYSFISCLMQSSLDPLELKIDPIDPLDADPAGQEAAEALPDSLRNLVVYPDQDLQSYDDIVISVFSIQTVNNARYTGLETNNEGIVNGRPTYVDFQTPPQAIDPASDIYKITYDLNNAGSGGGASLRNYPEGLQNIVVGRYPSNANECTQKGTDSSNAVQMDDTDPGFEIDPFDYLNADNGAVTTRTYGTSPDFLDYTLELTDIDGAPLADSGPEFQRGFSTTGQHRIDDPNVFCYGSEFSIADVEELINMPGFIQPNLYDPPSDDKLSAEYQAWLVDVYASQDERAFFEPQGMTLVEIFWQHDLLLNFALFRPLQRAYGEGDIVIALWSAFPLPSAAPNILYQLP